MPTEDKITKELRIMDERLTGLEENLESIDGKLTQVVDAILGNPLTKQGGMVPDMEQMKRDILALQKEQTNNAKFKSRVVWTIGTVATIAFIIQYLTSLYLQLKK